jgi:ribonucleoside-diphosphate reductase alpha chain
MEFISGYREANAPRRNGQHGANGNGNGHDANAPLSVSQPTAELNPPASGAIEGARQTPLEGPAAASYDGPHARSLQFERFQSDAPACDNCGAITVRNGNCYLCHNCGNSMGCS